MNRELILLQKRPRISHALAATLALCVTGCTTMGTGAGTLRSSHAAVTFQWQSTDSVSGSMTATLADGRSYTGPYFQITSEMRTDNLSFGGWRHWREPSAGFTTYYSGQTLAYLKAADDSRIRCSFMLIHPARGFSGGAQGECELPDKNIIDVSLDAKAKQK